MTTSNTDFQDLYGDALTYIIELKENPTFETIKSYFSESDQMEREFEYNGKKIIAQRKFTHKGNGGKMFQVKTNYLHVWIQVGKSENTMAHYRETKTGDFKTV